MLSVWITSFLSNVLSPTTVALGNFDGVHQGHRQVIAPILPQESQSQSAYPTVLTFQPHPQEFFSGQKRLLLTPVEQKVAILQELGIQQLVLLPFDAQLAALSPQAFVETILVQHLRAQRISVGENFRFGQRRSGTVDDLRAIAATWGIEVCIVPLENTQSERISSSRIRQALDDGDLALANHLLGYPYTLIGKVITGQQLGRTLGFPTANLELPPQKFLPCHGVYAVQVTVPTWAPDALELRGVMNLGYRPTVNGQQLTAEVHLFDWSADLYGHTLKVALKQFIRPEQKFTSLDELKAQIQQDCLQAQTW
jgi:riboflavin kinase / FMN adenylyltransferase